jgi:hypothetical protein
MWAKKASEALALGHTMRGIGRPKKEAEAE